MQAQTIVGRFSFVALALGLVAGIALLAMTQVVSAQEPTPSAVLSPLAAAAAAAANLDQVRNGPASAPDDPGIWVNGNVGGSTGHYAEGFSLPYRTVMTDLCIGSSITLVIGFDIKHGDHHAIDFLTTWDRIDNPLGTHSSTFGHGPEELDPTDGVVGVTPNSAPSDQFPIPCPTSVNSPVPGQPTAQCSSLPADQKLMSIWNGDITNVAYTVQGDLTASNSEAQVAITFTPSSTTALLAWGGHIASRLYWGCTDGNGNEVDCDDPGAVPRSAGGISGSPYHMRLKDWSSATCNVGNLGNQDRSMSAVAIVVPRPVCSVTPADTSVCQGTSATFTVTAASGNPPYTYAWTGPNGFSANSQTITILNAQPVNAGIYTATVTDNAEQAVSCSGSLTVTPTPGCTISGGPVEPICPGTTGLQYCGPEGLDTYQWSISGNGTISGVSNQRCVTVTAGNTCGASFVLSLTTTDGSCTANCQRSVDVDDNTPPTITCPGPVSVQCLADIPAPNNSLVTASDNCDQSLTITSSTGSLVGGACGGTVTRTYTATDNCGNSASCTQVFTVRDTQPPTITCPGPITVQCLANIPAPNNSLVTTSDNCDQSLTITNSTGPLVGGACGGTVTRTYTATDDCGNSASCTQVITVNDTQPPTITCPGPITVQCLADVPPPSNASVTASDNCDASLTITSTTGALVGGACGGTITRTYTATDDCGNSASCTQTITVDDNTPPILVCAPDETVDCSEIPDGKVVTSAMNFDALKDALGYNPIGSMTDNCGFVELSRYDIIANDLVCPYYYRIILQARDACGNLSDTCVWTLNVRDTTDPVITCPPNLDTQCDAGGTVEDWGWPTATEECFGGATIRLYDQDTVQGDCGYRITRRFLAVDKCGNADSCEQTISVGDATPPTITCPGPISVQCLANVPPANNALVTANDNCDQNLTITNSTGPLVGGACGGTITRTYTATDDCGNSASCTQIITVRDTQPPTITCPGPISVQCLSNVPPPNNGLVTASDNCDVSLTITNSTGPLVGGACGGTITRTYTATDDCGNSASCTQVFTVRDTQPPTISCPGPVSVQCLADVPPPSNALVTASDNCDLSLTITNSTGPLVGGGCGGTVTRTYTATDDCGNSASCTQIITVDDTQPPTITCPPPITVGSLAEVPPANNSLVIASDNCDDDLTITNSTGPLIGGICGGTITRTYTATDDCENSSSCTQIITVTDTDPPVCIQTEDASFFMCNPEQVCLPVGVIIPAAQGGTGTGSDVIGATKGGKSARGQARGTTPGTGGDNSVSLAGGIVTTCRVFSGAGVVQDGFWCYTPPDRDTVVHVVVRCTDECDNFCDNEFTVTFDLNQAPVCNRVDDASYFQCAPTQVCIPVGATDPDGNLVGCTVVNGPGTVVGGNWCYTPTGDETVNVTIRCTDECGDFCEEQFAVTFVINDAPICNIINDTTIAQCVPTQVCRPVGATDPNGNLTGCRIVSGPGTLSNGQWCYTPSGDETANVTIRCTDECGAFCEETFSVTFDINAPPICNVPNSTSFTQCVPQEVCLPISATDPDGNFDNCRILTGPGSLNKDGNWCYTPSDDETINVTIRCTDQCGAFCDGSFTVDFSLNDPPVINLGPDISQQQTIPPTQICLTYTVGDPDGLEGLIEALIEQPGGATFNTVTNQLCFTPPTSGLYTFVASVTDPCGAVGFDTVSILISQTNPPVCNLPNDTVILLCSPTQICLPVTASGANQPITCEITSGPGTLSNGQWCFTPSGSGEAVVEITCRNSLGAFCEGTFTVVYSTGLPPTCTPPRDTTICICPGQQACLPIDYADPDNDIVSVTKVSGPGTISGKQWCMSPTADGEHTIRYRVTDGCGLWVECSFKVIIDINDPPTFTIKDDTTFLVCPPGEVCYSLNVHDNNDNIVSGQVLSGPGYIEGTSWCLTPTSEGPFTVRIRFTDECGSTVTRQFIARFRFSDAPACNLPPSGKYVVCQAGQVCFPIYGSGPAPRNVTCVKLDGQGTVSGNNWCYNVPAGGAINVPITVRCRNLCDQECRITRTYTFQVNPETCGGVSGAAVGAGDLKTTTTFRTGDINGDGTRDIVDLSQLMKIVRSQSYRGKTTTIRIDRASAGYSEQADVNCDGYIDNADVDELYEYLFNKGPEPCPAK